MALIAERELDEIAERGMRTLVQVAVAAIGGAVLAGTLLPHIAPQMARTMDGGNGSVFWFLARSSCKSTVSMTVLGLLNG